jgi:hypothetical protein
MRLSFSYTVFVSILLLVATAHKGIAAEVFVIRLASGKVLFDENGIDSYNATTNEFTLTPAASKQLVSNWDEFMKDPEGIRPRGTFFNADNAAFDVLLGTKTIASGTVISAMMTFQSPLMPAVVLFGDMPLVQQGRVHVGIGKMNSYDALKKMVEEGPTAALTPVLGNDVAEHFHNLGKSMP